MAKVSKEQKFDSHHKSVKPYLSPSYPNKAGKVSRKKKCSKVQEKKDCENAKCSVCLEFPHNAVLLLCSSYDKGCRPYMCATSKRFSNCLEQYKKAYTKVTSANTGSMEYSSLISGVVKAAEQMEVPELLCPLCRGQVKGCTVVKPVRKYLNRKKRGCLQDKCSFVGTYKELKKHVKTSHPLARPRAVDPVLEEKWKKLENDRALNDVLSTITSSIPGAIVLGDYVIDPGYHDDSTYSDEYDSDDSFDDPFFDLNNFIHNDELFEMPRSFHAIPPVTRTWRPRFLGSAGLRPIPRVGRRNGRH